MPVFEEWRVAGLCSRRVRVRVWKVASPRPAHSDNSGKNDTSETRIGFRNATVASVYAYRRTLWPVLMASPCRSKREKGCPLRSARLY